MKEILSVEKLICSQVGRDGTIFSFGNSFFTGDIPVETPLLKRSLLDPLEALDVASNALQLAVYKDTSAEAIKETESYKIKGVSGITQDPEATLVYFVKSDDSLALTWRVETKTSEDWVVSYVDAEAEAESKVVGLVNYISHATYEV